MNCENCERYYTSADLEECETDQYWTNNGDRIVFHVCKYCGKSVEGMNFDLNEF